MKFLSVCSGIEAASVAWEPLGWTPVLYSEIEKFPRDVLKDRQRAVDANEMGASTRGVPLWGDFTAIRARHFDRLGIDLPEVLVGGTPCQAFSIAGLRRSLDDARGNLTLSFVRLANAIDNERKRRNAPPLVVTWENVPGVLSTKDNAFGCFLGALAGSDAPLIPPSGGKWENAGLVNGPLRSIAWRILDAQHFGVPQRRRRVFVIASARRYFDPGAVLFELDGLLGDTEEGRETGAVVAALTSCGVGTCGADDNQAQAGHLIAGTLLANGKAAGSATQQDAGNGLLIAHTLRGEGFDASEDGTGRGTPLVPVAFCCKDYGADAGETAPTLRAMGFTGSHANGGRQVAVAVPIQNATRGKSQNGLGIGAENAPMYTLDNGSQHGVAVAFAEDSRAEVRLEGGDGNRTGAISTGGGKPGQGVPTIATRFAVRRLTPRECERLQGFPDDYTLIPWRKKTREDCPDGPRYKALGNSMAVPVMHWIGARIQMIVDYFGRYEQ